MTDYTEALKKNIKIMNKLEGFDVVIVCCSSEKQAGYWQKRLEDGRGSVIPQSSHVLAVQEDWVGGAGNGNNHTHPIVHAYSSLISTFLVCS